MPFSGAAQSQPRRIMLDARAPAEQRGGNSHRAPTARQLELLGFVAEQIAAGLPPSLRDISAAFGMSSANSASDAGVATRGRFTAIWRCGFCGTARAGQGECPECEAAE